MPPKKKSSKRKASTGKKKPEPKKKRTANQKSIFPIHSIHQLMEQKLPGGVVKPEAALFLTAVMEYLAAEIMEQSMNVARSRTNSTDMTNVRLNVNDVETALHNDPELSELMEKVRERTEHPDEQ